jgi:hypothetical protein
MAKMVEDGEWLGRAATLVTLAVAVATQHFRWLGWRAVSDKDLVINGGEHSI